MEKLDESKLPELGKMKLEDELRLVSKNDRIHRVFANYWAPHLTKGTECFEALTGKSFTAKEMVWLLGKKVVIQLVQKLLISC